MDAGNALPPDPGGPAPPHHGVCPAAGNGLDVHGGNQAQLRGPLGGLRRAIGAKANGYLEKVPDGENKMRRIPTDLGRSIGLYTEARAGKYGEYQAIYYDSRAQQFLLEHLPEIFSK